MIVEGTQICIPPTGSAKASSIIKSMQRLLEARLQLRVGRRAFLAKWSKLRKALLLTDDYQEFRKTVLDRCEGICETCREAEAVHVHHIERVAYRPDLALVVSNAEGICERCHDTIHA